MAIADLGCATGPNALLMVTEAVEAVLAAEAEAECQQQSDKNNTKQVGVELHVFLNDLPGNDFNGVFRLLPASPLAATGRCRVSAWPGSFYGRVFPEASLDYVVSSSSLHFLSRAPPPLPAAAEPPTQAPHQQHDHRRTRIRFYISSSNSLAAYAAQFHSDFTAFLRCRSPEMRPGGLLLATFVARRTAVPTDHECYLWDLLAAALMDVVADEDKVRAFNAPYYSPSPDDLRRAIHEEGSFHVRTMQLFEVTRRGGGTGKEDEDEELLSRRLAVETASTIRAVVEPMVRTHFGFGLAAMDALFSRYSVLLEAYYRNKATRNKDDLTNVFLVLEKKHH